MTLTNQVISSVVSEISDTAAKTCETIGTNYQSITINPNVSGCKNIIISGGNQELQTSLSSLCFSSPEYTKSLSNIVTNTISANPNISAAKKTEVINTTKNSVSRISQCMTNNINSQRISLSGTFKCSSDGNFEISNFNQKLSSDLATNCIQSSGFKGALLTTFDEKDEPIVQKKELSVAEIAGISVGVIVFVILIILIIVISVKKLKR